MVPRRLAADKRRSNGFQSSDLGAEFRTTPSSRCVMITLDLRRGLFEELRAHLLPRDCLQEQAAFLYVKQRAGGTMTHLDCVEAETLGSEDFVSREADYIELEDYARVRLIKRAHQLEASLVEIHSHIGPWDAAFSDA